MLLWGMYPKTEPKLEQAHHKICTYTYCGFSEYIQAPTYYLHFLTLVIYIYRENQFKIYMNLFK